MSVPTSDNLAQPAQATRLHATCIALDGRGVLLQGPSGVGKSDLALRFITQPLLRPQARLGETTAFVRAQLVADDQVWLHRQGDQIMARPPALLAGRIEVRGLGIIALSHLPEVPVQLVVSLHASQDIERLPAREEVFVCHGISLPHVRLAPIEVSAPAKVVLALGMLHPILS